MTFGQDEYVSPTRDSSAEVVRAAEYVRMSTEHQQYSTENQGDAIRDYARQHNMEIVRTYSDAGKSGLNIEGRDGLKRLIADVEAGEAGFDVILVYLLALLFDWQAAAVKRAWLVPMRELESIAIKSETKLSIRPSVKDESRDRYTPYRCSGMAEVAERLASEFDRGS